MDTTATQQYIQIDVNSGMVQTVTVNTVPNPKEVMSRLAPQTPVSVPVTDNLTYIHSDVNNSGLAVIKLNELQLNTDWFLVHGNSEAYMTPFGSPRTSDLPSGMEVLTTGQQSIVWTPPEGLMPILTMEFRLTPRLNIKDLYKAHMLFINVAKGTCHSAPLPNIYGHGELCTGDINIPLQDRSITDSVASCVAQWANNQWNMDLTSDPGNEWKASVFRKVLRVNPVTMALMPPDDPEWFESLPELGTIPGSTEELKESCINAIKSFTSAY